MLFYYYHLFLFLCLNMNESLLIKKKLINIFLSFLNDFSNHIILIKKMENESFNEIESHIEFISGIPEGKE